MRLLSVPDPSLSRQEPVRKTFPICSTSQEIAPVTHLKMYTCNAMAVWVSKIGSHVCDQIETEEKVKRLFFSQFI